MNLNIPLKLTLHIHLVMCSNFVGGIFLTIFNFWIFIYKDKIMSKEMREQIDRVKNWKQFLNENKYSENEVVSFINKKMLEDKKEYRGHTPTKYNKGSEWSDFSWLVDEIHNFLQNECTTSYILREFSDKYDTDTLKEIVRNNFKQEYEYVLQNFEVGG